MEPDWQPALIDTYLACKRQSCFQQTPIILNYVDTIFFISILVIAVHLCNLPLDIKVKNIQNPAQKPVWPAGVNDPLMSTLTPIWQQSHGWNGPLWQKLKGGQSLDANATNICAKSIRETMEMQPSGTCQNTKTAKDWNRLRLGNMNSALWQPIAACLAIYPSVHLKKKKKQLWEICLTIQFSSKPVIFISAWLQTPRTSIQTNPSVPHLALQPSACYGLASTNRHDGKKQHLVLER